MYKLASGTLLLSGLLAFTFNAHASIGAQTAAAMQNNFDATPQRCAGENDNPAHACSGVLIRSTRPSPAYHTWHHSQNSKDKGGVSFSYLRADIPIHRLAEDARSGFTLYPVQQRPKDSLHYDVLCAWPTDGDSWTREERGCGNNLQTDETEAFCHLQGVTSAEDWIAHFRNSNDYKRQCAFDLQHQDRTSAFFQSVRAKQLYSQELPFSWNEVIIGTWDESKSSTLPIQSFFYIAGQRNGLEQARTDQQDWHTTNGAFIPVIRVQFSGNSTGRTEFSYRESDQAVSPDA